MSRIAVVGASGRTGSALSAALIGRGHDVLALCRTAPAGRTGSLEHRPTDVLDPVEVRTGLAGADAVVVALGISENPLAVRLRGARETAGTVRSQGTRHVVQAMGEHGVRRLVVLSSYGVGDSWSGLSSPMKLIIGALLRPQFRDHEEQEGVVRNSGLDWTIARPVNLRDADSGGTRSAGPDPAGPVRGPLVADPHMRTVSMDVGRGQVADQLAEWVTSDADTGRTVALSS